MSGDPAPKSTSAASASPPEPRPEMYAENRTDDYLQGDVYADVPIVTVRVDERYEKKPLGEAGLRFTATERIRIVVLLSHSCDSDSTHQAVTDDDDLQVAILNPVGSNERDELGGHGGWEAVNNPKSGEHIHDFCYLPWEGIGEDLRWISLSQIHTVKRKYLKRDKKLLELTPEARGRLKAKLFLHFSRKEHGVPEVDPEVISRVLEPRAPIAPPSAAAPTAPR